MAEINDAPGRFRRFIDEARKSDATLTDQRVAGILGVSPAALSSWLNRRVVPKWSYRRAIERWTSGVVRALDWETPDERAELLRIIPASMPGGREARS